MGEVLAVVDLGIDFVAHDLVAVNLVAGNAITMPMVGVVIHGVFWGNLADGGGAVGVVNDDLIALAEGGGVFAANAWAELAEVIVG